MTLIAWLAEARALGASDLHFESGTAVVARVGGDLKVISESVQEGYVAETARELLGVEGWAQFQARGSADLSTTLGEARYRLNVYQTSRGVAIAVRLLTQSVHNLRACNLHPDLRRLTEPTTGLVIVSGPTGSGKSTTLAALIEEINSSRARHIITIESPMEYAFTSRRSFIRQREIPTHSPSYEQAIIDALRQNPDVLVVGEMRTPEVMRLTLNAAETGHLVLATMHSATCGEALSRLCMSFPPEIHNSIRAQVADCLVGIVCQRLEYLSTYQLRVPRCELLLASSAAKGTIRAGQFSQIANVVQAGGDEGMWSFDRYQRWMYQNKDWTHGTQLASPPEIPVTRPVAAAPRAPLAKDDAIEISIDEDVSLAELARRLEEKTR
jgi:twitching motility protein PilT